MSGAVKIIRYFCSIPTGLYLYRACSSPHVCTNNKLLILRSTDFFWKVLIFQQDYKIIFKAIFGMCFWFHHKLRHIFQDSEKYTMFIMSSSNSVGIIIAPLVYRLLRYSSLYTHLKNAKLVGTISWKSSLFLLLPLLHNYQIVFVMIKKSCWSSIAIWNIVGFLSEIVPNSNFTKKIISYIWGWIWWLILFAIAYSYLQIFLIIFTKNAKNQMYVYKLFILFYPLTYIYISQS